MLRLARVEEAVVSLRHSLTTTLTVMGGILTFALALLAYTTVSLGNASRELNSRFDRFLEREAMRAEATDARTNRLLEMLAAEARRAPTPNVIVVPGQPPAH